MHCSANLNVRERAGDGEVMSLCSCDAHQLDAPTLIKGHVLISTSSKSLPHQS
jgi:hypothetical protein